MTTFDEDLEKLFLSSRWSDRLPPEIIIKKHIEFASTESEKAKQSIPCSLDISYGALSKEKIDIFGTDLQNDSNIMVYIHGGYWQVEALKRETYHFLASKLYKNGIKSVLMGYELCPKVTLEKIIEETEAAIRKCIAYAKENNNKGLVLVGHSAGAHLIASLFTDLAKSFNQEERKFIKSAVLIAGLYDLTQLRKTSFNEALQLNEEEASRLSPQRRDFVEDVTTKFYVISAEKDSPEFARQAEEFHKKIKDAGISSTFMHVDGVDHFNVIELLDDADFEVSGLIWKLCQE